MDSVINYKDSNQQLSELLQKYQNENENEFRFLKKEGLEKKKIFVSFLFGLAIDHEQTEEVRKNSLGCLRLLCRETPGLEYLVTYENLEKLFSLMGVTDGDKKAPLSVRVEAAKCGVNLTLKHKEEIEYFLLPTSTDPTSEADFLEEKNCDKLKKFLLLLEEPDFQFPVGRICFHLSLDEKFQEPFRDLNAGLYFAKAIERIFRVDSSGNVNNSDQMNLKECLKVIMALTTSIGPLGDSGPSGRKPTQNESEWFDILCPIFEKILLTNDVEMNHSLKSEVVGCLINVPNSHISCFNQQLIVPALLKYLDRHIIHCESKGVDLIPILLILHSISRASKEVRKIVRQHIFPPDFSSDTTPLSIKESSEIERGDSIAAKLVQHMTSSHFVLKHYSQELLFTLCDEDADEFSRLAGFGSAAGLLANRNLLHSFSGLGSPSRSPSKKETKSNITTTTTTHYSDSSKDNLKPFEDSQSNHSNE